MTNRRRLGKPSVIRTTLLAGCLAIGFVGTTHAQTEQQVNVRIRNFTFIATKAPLMLNVPAVITLLNEDGERHDFRSPVFQGILTHAETGGTATYGRGIGGVFVDPNAKAVIRFTVKRSGRYQFKCSIHSHMKGELLLLNIQAV